MREASQYSPHIFSSHIFRFPIIFIFSYFISTIIPISDIWHPYWDPLPQEIYPVVWIHFFIWISLFFYHFFARKLLMKSYNLIILYFPGRPSACWKAQDTSTWCILWEMNLTWKLKDAQHLLYDLPYDLPYIGK